MVHLVEAALVVCLVALVPNAVAASSSSSNLLLASLTAVNAPSGLQQEDADGSSWTNSWLPQQSSMGQGNPHQQQQQPKPLLQDSRPYVIAHRGASGLMPEHTLPAYATAIAQGADFIGEGVHE